MTIATRTTGLLNPAAGALVSITDRTVQKNGNGTGTATATYSLVNDGNVKNHNGTVLEVWKLSGAVGDYEARAHNQGGDAPSGAALDTWLALSSTRSWSLVAGVPQNLSCTLLVEIRLVSTGVVQDSATINLHAENTG